MSDHSQSMLAPMVSKLDRWIDLQADDRTAILALPFHKRTLSRHSFIVNEGERATHSCILLSGFAIRQKIVAQGGRQIIAVHMKGDLLDLQN